MIQKICQSVSRFTIYTLKTIVSIACSAILTSCIAGGYMPRQSAERYMTLTFEDPELTRRVVDGEKICDRDYVRLSKSWSYGVRSRIAGNRFIPPELLPVLANDKHEMVRRCVAGNPFIDRKLIDKFLKDPDKYVTLSLAHNPSVPENILWDIYRRYKGMDYIDSNFLANPKCPPQIKKELEAVRDERVKRQIEFNRKHNITKYEK